MFSFHDHNCSDGDNNTFPKLYSQYQGAAMGQDAFKPYVYKYGIQDDLSGTNFEKSESKNVGGNVEGSFSVVLPDGRIQTVSHIHLFVSFFWVQNVNNDLHVLQGQTYYEFYSRSHTRPTTQTVSLPT